MSFFDKLLDFVSGGIGGKIVDVVAAQFPPNMSEQEKEQMKFAISQASRQYDLELLNLAQKEQESFNARLKDLEGTASDLNNAGRPGRIILFLRGAQRPIWGFAVLYMDFMVFSGSWKLTDASSINDSATSVLNFDLQSAFWIINFLVLGFLFGERAMRNVIPFFQGRLQSGSSKQISDDTQNRAVG